ncbi:MAG: TRAP transporter small permease subunit [Rhodospirillaceae bacterium]|nr:TRAP transporter small permease subunit [Rhodospirillaceae bacterium]
MLKVREALERLSEVTGSVVAWLTVLMVIGTFVIVVLRYGFDLGWIAMQESIIWMHAAVFMLGAAYTLKRDEHVRVDIFYRRMSARRQALVDLAGTAVFLLPMAVFLTVSSWDYVATSWAIREASREAGGLPYPFVPILKSLIPATALMLTLQGVAILIGSVLTLSERRPSPPPPDAPRGEAL